MNDSCCCIDAHDNPEFSKQAIKKARKQYRCIECGELIQKGDTYHCFSGIWDGQWDHMRTCIPCAQIRNDLFSCGFIFGEMREHFLECNGWDYITGEEQEKYYERLTYE